MVEPTPPDDLRTLAAETRMVAYRAARDWADQHGHPQPDDRMLDVALAAVLPAHRRQVLDVADLAEAITYARGLGQVNDCPWCQHRSGGEPCSRHLAESMVRDLARIRPARPLASTETAATSPAGREAPEAQGPAQGDCGHDLEAFESAAVALTRVRAVRDVLKQPARMLPVSLIVRLVDSAIGDAPGPAGMDPAEFAATERLARDVARLRQRLDLAQADELVKARSDNGRLADTLPAMDTTTDAEKADSRIRAAYMRISPHIADGAATRTIQASETVLVDIGEGGQVLGVECLGGPVTAAALFTALSALRVAPTTTTEGQ